MPAEVNLEQSDHGIILPIKAMPGARSNAVRGVHDGRLRVAVTQVAEKGKANKAILKTLARMLNLSPSQLEIVGGTLTAQKRVQISGIEFRELQSRVRALVGD